MTTDSCQLIFFQPDNRAEREHFVVCADTVSDSGFAVEIDVADWQGGWNLWHPLIMGQIERVW